MTKHVWADFERLDADDLNGNFALVPDAGNAFPGGPSSGDRFYRTDYHRAFYYDGTRWLSEQLDQMLLLQTENLSATRASTGIGPAPTSIGSDIYLVTLVTHFLVSGGTALSGSHKWVGAFNKQPTGNTDTLVATVTIDSGSSSVWRTDSQSINALQNGGTLHYRFSDAWTKTGTPGNLYIGHYVTYRHVAT